MKPKTELPVFNPTSRVQLAGGCIEVHELKWPDALSFFNKLRDQAKGLVNDKGEICMDANKLMEAIGDNVELAAWLVEKSTGMDAQWIEQRSLSEMLDIITAALEVNIGIIASKIKNVKSRLVSATAGELPPKSSPTSQPSAT
jgi:hypothetical protein